MLRLQMVYNSFSLFLIPRESLVERGDDVSTDFYGVLHLLFFFLVLSDDCLRLHHLLNKIKVSLL